MKVLTILMNEEVLAGDSRYSSIALIHMSESKQKFLLRVSTEINYRKILLDKIFELCIYSWIL